MLPFKLHFVCPRDGRKLSKVDAMEYATLNVRRTCATCRRRYSITIVPASRAIGWTHTATLTALEQKVTLIE